MYDGFSRFTLLPAIVFTSSSARKDVEQWNAADANVHLTKPVGPADLESLVEKFEQFRSERLVLPPIPA